MLDTGLTEKVLSKRPAYQSTCSEQCVEVTEVYKVSSLPRQCDPAERFAAGRSAAVLR